MVTVGLTVSEKSPGQTNPRTNRQGRKDYSRRATITNKLTREPLSKGDSRMGLIAFHIQLPLATLASVTHFILHTSF